jgi:hypothetical protein
MKLALFAATLLLIAGCAPAQSYRSAPGNYSGGAESESGVGSTTTASQPAPANSYSQDAVECERKAAFAGIGSKGQAFANCMRARGHTPGR